MSGWQVALHLLPFASWAFAGIGVGALLQRRADYREADRVKALWQSELRVERADAAAWRSLAHDLAAELRDRVAGGVS